jgi:hypothetical protein
VEPTAPHDASIPIWIDMTRDRSLLFYMSNARNPCEARTLRCQMLMLHAVQNFCGWQRIALPQYLY